MKLGFEIEHLRRFRESRYPPFLHSAQHGQHPEAELPLVDARIRAAEAGAGEAESVIEDMSVE